MKRVLVTGATGFVGRHCIPALLDRGYEVHAAGWPTAPAGSSSVAGHACNLFDAYQTAKLVQSVKATHLLHLAWCTAPGEYWMSPDNYRWVEASTLLVEEFRRLGGERVTVAGTCAEYDWSQGVLSEHDTPCSPQTVYGACKLALQRKVAELARETKMSAAWGRLFFLYGPYEHPDRFVPSMIIALLAGRKATCRQGQQIRDYLHTEDAANALVALLDSDVQGPVNIGSGESISLADISLTIGRLLDRTDLIEIGSQHGRDSSVLVADVRRLREVLGWAPKLDLEQGLARAISWWKDRTSYPEHEPKGSGLTGSTRQERLHNDDFAQDND